MYTRDVILVYIVYIFLFFFLIVLYITVYSYLTRSVDCQPRRRRENNAIIFTGGRAPKHPTRQRGVKRIIVTRCRTSASWEAATDIGLPPRAQCRVITCKVYYYVLITRNIGTPYVKWYIYFVILDTQDPTAAVCNFILFKPK